MHKSLVMYDFVKIMSVHCNMVISIGIRRYGSTLIEARLIEAWLTEARLIEARLIEAP